jgi:CubicO group peptidase (beta-lactamase class C family)
MRKVIVAVLAGDIVLVGIAAAAFRPDRALRITTGVVSHAICSGVFISHLPAEQVYRQVLEPERGLARMGRLLRYAVDPGRKEVVARIAGLFESHAVYHSQTGCLVLRGPTLPRNFSGSQASDGAPVPLLQPAAAGDGRAAARAATDLPEIAGPAVVEPTDERLRTALDRAFAEAGDWPPRWTQAVVVVHEGRVIAERYAPGVGVHTALWGHSTTKSVINALIGILVRQKRLAVDQPAPIPAWRKPGDPRGSITVDQLLRMHSGLGWDEDRAGFDPATRMWYLEPDMAVFAERALPDAAPGTRFAYSNLGYLNLSRIIRDAVGGHDFDVLSFARRELFGPLGMEDVTLEFDAAGTPIGSSHLYASARDWARFGMLYLNDGVVGDRRILPEGWVVSSTSPTLSTGYGSGFWLNSTREKIPVWGGRWGMPEAPREAFFARGYLGQFVVVIPSRRVVIVRLGQTHWPTGDIEGVGRLVADVLDTLR